MNCNELENQKTTNLHFSLTMEAIVKKMQAMKVEKDNAMDDSDTWEVKARDANTRRAKLEEDLNDLIMKS